MAQVLPRDGWSFPQVLHQLLPRDGWSFPQVLHQLLPLVVAMGVLEPSLLRSWC